MGSFLFKAGVLDYQTFAKNLQVLEVWITEAEEILKGQDPSHSSDLSAIQSRMEELKVSNKYTKCSFFYIGLVNLHRVCTNITLYILKNCHSWEA